MTPGISGPLLGVPLLDFELFNELNLASLGQRHRGVRGATLRADEPDGPGWFLLVEVLVAAARPPALEHAGDAQQDDPEGAGTRGSRGVVDSAGKARIWHRTLAVTAESGSRGLEFVAGTIEGSKALVHLVLRRFVGCHLYLQQKSIVSDGAARPRGVDQFLAPANRAVEIAAVRRMAPAYLMCCMRVLPAKVDE